MKAENIRDWFLDNLIIILGCVFIAIIALLIAGALYTSAIQPKEGVVIRKDYYPAYTTTTYSMITQSNGTTTRIPIQNYHAERYQITIKGINSKGEESLGYYDVTPIEYEEIQIGDYYIKQAK